MMLKMPCVSVTASLVRFVSRLRIVTVAPGTIDPCGSFTTPVTLPYRICAETLGALNATRNTRRAIGDTQRHQGREKTLCTVPLLPKRERRPARRPAERTVPRQ